MNDAIPTAAQRLILDIVDNIPPEWDCDITYPSLPTVDHSFDSYPEVVLTHVHGGNTTEVAVRAVIPTDSKLFRGYVVTTSAPNEALLTANCENRRLTSLSHEERVNTGVDITHHKDYSITSDHAIDIAVPFSVAVALASYYSATLDTDALAPSSSSPSTVSVSNN